MKHTILGLLVTAVVAACGLAAWLNREEISLELQRKRDALRLAPPLW